jgi:hypothetical protein
MGREAVSDMFVLYVCVGRWMFDERGMRRTTNSRLKLLTGEAQGVFQ